MHRGWFKTWRKIRDSEIWLKPMLYKRVWDWILIDVNWETGMTTTTLNQIADGVRYEERGVIKVPNRKTIASILKYLEDSGQIKRESNRHFTTLTVVNWSTYQSREDAEVTQDGQQDGQQDGHSLRSSKKVKEVKADRERSGASDLVECGKLVSQMEKTLGHLGAQGFHLARLESYRKKLSDADIEAVVVKAAEWIQENTPRKPWSGIFGCLDNHLENPQKDFGNANNGTSKHADEDWPDYSKPVSKNALRTGMYTADG